MSLNDPIGDMIARIKNAQLRNHKKVELPSSNFKVKIADVLKTEGYIRDFQKEELKDGIYKIKIELKYFKGMPVIKKIKRISKPGIRVYSKINDLQKSYGGLGISILSTPKWVMSDQKARDNNVGGEILCEVF